MITDVKICGLSDIASIEAAIEGGARQLGFVFFEKSPRNISAHLAGELTGQYKGSIKRIAVSVNATDGKLEEIIGKMDPDQLQLHGTESPDRVQKIKDQFGLPVIKAFAIRQATDFNMVEQYLGIADRLLFDAKPPAGADLPGGNGVAFDWKLFADWQDQHYFQNNDRGKDNLLDSSTSPMLSGGINLNNVEIALANSNAQAIDISSGVEEAPGVKDPVLIMTFLEQVKCYDSLRDNGRKDNG
ncbi:MAG: phosphoribosylanthranilate isomerase [Hyphomicrobiales bacterium]|nr:phosphoribosylanthranilate isomerase [Hyphomicrobiales bacterium]